MRPMRTIIRIVTAAALVFATTSCGTAVRTGSSAQFLSIDSLLGVRGKSGSGGQGTAVLSSDVITLVTTGGTCSAQNPCATIFSDNGQAALKLVPKNPLSATNPSSTEDVTISRIHVEYRRTDGRNTPGSDVPFPFDTFITLTIPGGGSGTASFELVRSQAKVESPLLALQNTGRVISVIADVTFYGQDRAGNTISATGSIEVDFADFGDF
jgi:hypothetical protein